MLAIVLKYEFWLLLEVTLGVGLFGADMVVYGVPKAKFKATKCSWLQTMRKKSNL